MLKIIILFALSFLGNAQTANLPEAIQNRVISYLADDNPAIHKIVSKNYRTTYSSRFGDPEVKLRHLVANIELVKEAMANGYERWRLLMAAVKEDNVEAVNFLITPTKWSFFGTWEAAEIQFLKQVEIGLVEQASSIQVLETLREHGFKLSSTYNFGRPIERTAENCFTHHQSQACDFFVYLVLKEGLLNPFSISLVAQMNEDLEFLKLLAPAIRKENWYVYFRLLCHHSAERGEIEILEWVHTHLRKCEPLELGKIKKNPMDVIRWAEANKISISFKYSATEQAVKEGTLEYLQWIHNKRNVIIDRPFFDYPLCIFAAKYGRVDILDWAVSVEIPCNIEKEIIFQAKLNNHEDVEKWAIDNLVPVSIDESHCESAAFAGSIDALDWIRSRGFVCKPSSYSGALANGHLHVIEWAGTHGVVVEVERDHLIKAAEKGHVEALKWAASVGALIPQEKLQDLLPKIVKSSKGLHALQWLFLQVDEEKRQAVIEDTIKDCFSDCRGQCIPFLKWVVNNGFGRNNIQGLMNFAMRNNSNLFKLPLDVSPDAIGSASADELVTRGYYNMLKLFIEKGGKLTDEDCKNAILHNHFRVLDLLVLEENLGDKCLNMAKAYGEKAYGGIVGTWAGFKTGLLRWLG